jgi:hypothetical protein
MGSSGSPAAQPRDLLPQAGQLGLGSIGSPALRLGALALGFGPLPLGLSSPALRLGPRPLGIGPLALLFYLLEELGGDRQRFFTKSW